MGLQGRDHPAAPEEAEDRSGHLEKELPTISVLVNKKELLKHTQLVAFEAPAVRPDARKK